LRDSLGRKHLSGERLSGRFISSGSGGLEGLGGVRPNSSRRLLDAGLRRPSKRSAPSTSASAVPRIAEARRHRLRQLELLKTGSEEPAARFCPVGEALVA
jgi:hypothetical protein